MIFPVELWSFIVAELVQDVDPDCGSPEKRGHVCKGPFQPLGALRLTSSWLRALVTPCWFHRLCIGHSIPKEIEEMIKLFPLSICSVKEVHIRGGCIIPMSDSVALSDSDEQNDEDFIDLRESLFTTEAQFQPSSEYDLHCLPTLRTLRFDAYLPSFVPDMVEGFGIPQFSHFFVHAFSIPKVPAGGISFDGNSNLKACSITCLDLRDIDWMDYAFLSAIPGYFPLLEDLRIYGATVWCGLCNTCSTVNFAPRPDKAPVKGEVYETIIYSGGNGLSRVYSDRLSTLSRLRRIEIRLPGVGINTPPDGEQDNRICINDGFVKRTSWSGECTWCLESSRTDETFTEKWVQKKLHVSRPPNLQQVEWKLEAWDVEYPSAFGITDILDVEI